MLLPHRGGHTEEYRQMALAGMREADRIADGNVDDFIREFKRLVIDPVVDDPGLMYK